MSNILYTTSKVAIPSGMCTPNNKRKRPTMGPRESEYEWACNDEVDSLSAKAVNFDDTIFALLTGQQNVKHLPNALKNSFEQLQGVGKKRLTTTCGLLPIVLVSPKVPAAKRIKREYNRYVTTIRCSIPDAYTKIKKLNYEIRKLTAPAEISRVQSELNKNHDIILRAQSQMRTAHQEKKAKLGKVKSPAIFRYLTNNDKKAAKWANFHMWSPLKKNLCHSNKE